MHIDAHVCCHRCVRIYACREEFGQTKLRSTSMRNAAIIQYRVGDHRSITLSSMLRSDADLSMRCAFPGHPRIAALLVYLCGHLHNKRSDEETSDDTCSCSGEKCDDSTEGWLQPRYILLDVDERLRKAVLSQENENLGIHYISLPSGLGQMLYCQNGSR